MGIFWSTGRTMFSKTKTSIGHLYFGNEFTDGKNRLKSWYGVVWTSFAAWFMGLCACRT